MQGMLDETDPLICNKVTKCANYELVVLFEIAKISQFANFENYRKALGMKEFVGSAKLQDILDYRTIADRNERVSL